MTGGLASTGRYVYFFLPPLLLAAASWAERAEEALRSYRWGRRLAVAVLLLFVIGTSLRTRRLAAEPFETHAGPVLYHFAVMWMLDYRGATGYVRDELGCPGRESLEEASSWGAALAAQAKEPALQVMGSVVRIGRKIPGSDPSRPERARSGCRDSGSPASQSG